MKVDAEHIETIRKTLSVEIDFPSVLYKAYWKSQKDKPTAAQYIRNGFWYVHDFYDYHKGYDVEKQDRKATAEEIQLHEAYKLLLSKLED